MITVQVRDGSGGILRDEIGAGVDNFFQASSSQYPLLAHIVPWSDTAFNRSQVSALLRELDRYEGDSIVDAGGVRFDWLSEMCQVATAQPHRMLWFVGD